MKSFSNGIWLKHNKVKTQGKPIEEAALPQRVIIPLQQHLGCPADAMVKVGDEVVAGQKIGESAKFIFAPIHASISGKIMAIEWRPNICGFNLPSVVIEGSGKNDQITGKNLKSLEELTAVELKSIAREAGLVGLGGATFPTHVKLSPPPDKKVETVILNGCECEPYITVDHRLMVERPEEIIFGAKAIQKALSAQKVVIAIEKNKPDAIAAMREQIAGLVDFEVAVLDTKYPQGGEKMLIKAITGKEVPAGGLPLDLSIIVSNIGTVVAFSEAIRLGRPLIQRAISVTGSGVVNPRNLYVWLGTQARDVLAQCGGLTDDCAKVIMGGPMTGLAVTSLDMPVVKGTNCLLALKAREAKVFEENDCIRCGRCIKACPTGLMPNFLAANIKAKNWEKTEEYHVADCIECGCCAYVCPSRINLVQYFKIGKRELQTRRAVCK